jgi:hypothetical protein
MSSKKPPSGKEPSSPKAAVEEMVMLEDTVELSLKISNPLDRAIHYISDVRGVLVDPSTGQVRVKLSEEGLELPPGGIAMEPRFRQVDPHSDAVVKVRLPKTIVKLAQGSSTGNEPEFEEHAIAEAPQIQVDIGWSDTPYYRDPREKGQGVSPFGAWEKARLRVTYSPPQDKKNPPNKK